MLIIHMDADFCSEDKENVNYETNVKIKKKVSSIRNTSFFFAGSEFGLDIFKVT